MKILNKLYNWSSSWTGTVVIVLVIIFFIAQAFVIPSGSMKNSLLIGDMLFVKKFSYGVPTPTLPWVEVEILPDFDGDGHLFSADGPSRGDITVFRYPHDKKIHYVKRCVAVEGDILFLKDKKLYLHPHQGDEYIKKEYKDQTLVTIDDMLFVVEPYKTIHKGIHYDQNVTRESSPHMELFDFGPIQVPKGSYFMMGDNRDHSNDSRFWGVVPYKFIVGKPWFVYFSWDKDRKIRWQRVFKSTKQLEQLDSYKSEHKDGIY
ncbi:MAG: signal peptidase I [Campylobacteraceae bacterium 4484_166]|nr:MAG: signal peptidase I [Campylobacteraceae bacterium 4484_166]